jgi:D-alanine-D-alanine ligase
MKRIAVVRGGPSSEYDISLKTGAAVLQSLKKLEYPYKDITITKKGEWLDNGFLRPPEKALDAVDVVFVALHGEYGEDGQIQRLLQRLKIPFTGSNALSSAIAFNKELTKRTLSEKGIKLAKHRRVGRDALTNLSSEIDYIRDTLQEELLVKAVASGSSIGVTYVPKREYLRDALTTMLSQYETVLVEEFIRGKEATVGVVESFRGHDIYALPPVEIIPPHGLPVFSTDVKYSGETTYICPGRFSYEEKITMADIAIAAHRALHCSQYSRSDFIIKNGEVYFLEINTLPGLTEQSLLPKAAAAVGVDFATLVEHLINGASV